jgi:hypothetical protein
MPKKDALVCLRETTDRVQKGLKAFRKGALGWDPFDPAHDRAEYIQVMNKPDWKKLNSLAQSLTKGRQKMLADIEKSRKQILSLMPLLDDLDKVAPGLPPPLPKIAGWKEQRKKLAAALLKKQLAPDKIEAILKAEEKRDFRKAPQQLRATLDPAIERLENTRQRHVASIMGAAHADAVARFNTSYKKAKPYNAAETKVWCRKNYGMLLDGETTVWQLLRDGKPATAAAEAAKLRKKAETSLKAGAEQAASVAARRRQPCSGASENIATLWVAEVIRGLLRAIALGYVAESALSWGTKMNPTQEWIKAAVKLPFAGYAAPTAIPVRQFKKRTTGKEYTIAGVVTGVSITHRAGKAVSAVKIASDKDTQITAALSHIKLDSGGMVPGANVRLTGTWTESIKWLPGSQALVVKRLNYGVLSQKGWRDWVTAEIRNVYAPIPHGLAALWSWEPGTTGAGNPLYYGVWYEN